MMTFTLRSRDDTALTLPKPAVMGIVNVSPDSFHNPCHSIDEAIKLAEHLVKSGADILDIGGEATNPTIEITKNRPGEQQELDRVVAAVEAIRARFEVLISIDTSRAKVMQASVDAGADMINDQRALSEDGALEVVAKLKTPVCLMHFFDKPRRPGSSTPEQLLAQIKQDLLARVAACCEAGITKDRIVLDPGFGQGNYGKNTKENFYLLTRLQELTALGFPVLSGWSRKSMIGEALGGRKIQDRLFGSIAVDSIAAYQGVSIIRGHDVAALKDAVSVVRHATELLTN